MFKERPVALHKRVSSRKLIHLRIAHALLQRIHLRNKSKDHVGRKVIRWIDECGFTQEGSFDRHTASVSSPCSLDVQNPIPSQDGRVAVCALCIATLVRGVG